MRIVVMGSGGTGGYFGAKLARAGEDVTFVARGAHLAALRANGMRIKSAVEGEWTVRAPAVERLDGLPPADLVLFCVKSFDTEEAAALIRPVVGPDTGVLSIQNGVDNEEKLARVLGAGHVLGGAVRVFATIEAPGVITHVFGGHLAFGEMDGRETARARALLAACQKASIPVELVGDVTRTLWDKYVFLTTHAGMTALTRCPAGVLRAVPEVREVYRRHRDRDHRGRTGRRREARRRDAGAGVQVPRHGGPERVLVAPPRPDARQAARAGGPPRPRGAAGRAPPRARAHRLRDLRGAAPVPGRRARDSRSL